MGYSDYRECADCSYMAPELAPCEKCDKEICDGCEYPCGICGGNSTCEDCTIFCDICGDAVCDDCQVESSIDRSIACKSCRQKCVICGTTDSMNDYISCDGCQQLVCDEDHIECASCGTRRCRQCVAPYRDCCEFPFCDDCHLNEEGVCIRQPE